MIIVINEFRRHFYFYSQEAIKCSSSTINLLWSLNGIRWPFPSNLGAIKIRIFPIRFTPELLLTDKTKLNGSCIKWVILTKAFPRALKSKPLAKFKSESCQNVCNLLGCPLSIWTCKELTWTPEKVNCWAVYGVSVLEEFSVRNENWIRIFYITPCAYWIGHQWTHAICKKSGLSWLKLEKFLIRKMTQK